jgi:hypothetical protein
MIEIDRTQNMNMKVQRSEIKTEKNVYSRYVVCFGMPLVQQRRG